MNTIIKKTLLNGRLWSAVISAVGAIVSAVLAGCKLYVGELSCKDVGCELLPALLCTTNNPY